VQSAPPSTYLKTGEDAADHRQDQGAFGRRTAYQVIGTVMESLLTVPGSSQYNLGRQGGPPQAATPPWNRRFLMRSALCHALTELEQEARAVGRADLVPHVQGCRQILESICQ